MEAEKVGKSNSDAEKDNNKNGMKEERQDKKKEFEVMFFITQIKSFFLVFIQLNPDNSNSQ